MTRVAPNFIYPRTVPVYVTTNPSLPITLEDVYYVRAILSRTKWRAFFRGPSVRIFLEARSRQEFRNGSDHYYLTRNLTVFCRARAHDYFVGIAVGRPVRRQTIDTPLVSTNDVVRRRKRRLPIVCYVHATPKLNVCPGSPVPYCVLRN